MTEVVNCFETSTVACVNELDRVLDSIHGSCDPRQPVVATIESPHGWRVDIGLGAPESLVIVWPDWPSSTADTYYLTTGPRQSAGTKCFLLHGVGHTEFEKRHLIPIHQARQVVRQFFETGIRSPDVDWEQQQY